jgi:hypothetical protein
MNTNKQKTLFRITYVALILTFGMLMPACGGGGSDGGVTNPLVARFTADNLNPGAETISMAGTSAGSNVAVEIQVTGLDNFGGAAFRVTYDPDTVNFTGFDASGSVLETLGVDTDYDANEAISGTILVYASIQDASQPAGVDVVGTQNVITLNFQATTSTAGNTVDFAAISREVQICPTQGQACSPFAGDLGWDGGMITASR